MDFDVYPFDKELYLSDFDEDEDEFDYDIDAPLTEITEYKPKRYGSKYLGNGKVYEIVVKEVLLQILHAHGRKVKHIRSHIDTKRNRPS